MQLIITITLLLIPNVLKTMYYTYTIFKFIILHFYLLRNNKTLFYIEHILYKFNKINIAFENHRPIDLKQF